MPNFIYPSATDYFVKRKIRKLNKKTKSNLEEKLKKWLQASEGNARILDDLPISAPEWAFNAQANGQDMYEFIPSFHTDNQVDKLVAYLKDIERLSKSEQHHQHINEALNTLRSLKRIGIDTLIKKANEWFKSHKTPSLLAALNINKRSVVCNSGKQWLEAKDLEQIIAWGKELKNCLKNGHYDEEFESGSVRIFGLYGENHKLLAASAFKNDYLLELEARGIDADERYINAINYRDDLFILIEQLGFAVEAKKFRDHDLAFELNNDVRIYQETDISKPPLQLNGFSFWLTENSTSLIVGFDKYKDFFDVPVSQSTHEYEELYSIFAGASEILLSSSYIDCLCRVLQKLVNDNLLKIDLAQYHEFSMNGIYWKDQVDEVVKSKVGILYSDGQEAWWQYGNDIIKWCSPELGVSLSLNLRNSLFTNAKSAYERYGAFERALSQLSIPNPDMPTNELGEPSIGLVKSQRESIGSSDYWQEVDISDDGQFTIKKRTVDDYVDTVKTEQYVCDKKGYGLVAGVLVRQKSTRKYHAYTQAPGNYPSALYLLESNLPTNNYSELFFNHDVKFNKKYIDEYFCVNRRAVVGRDYLSELNVHVTEYPNRIYVFDCNEQLILLLVKEHGSIVNFHDFNLEQSGGDLLIKLSLIMNITFCHEVSPLLKMYGYRVGHEGELLNAKPAIEYKSDIIEIEKSDEFVEVKLLREDDPITVTLYIDYPADINNAIDTTDDDFITLRKAVLAAVEYYDLNVYLEDLILFGIEEHAGSHRLSNITYPSNWLATKRGPDITWTLDLKDDITLFNITIEDSIINCPVEEFEELLLHKAEVTSFIAWFTKEKNKRVA
jgi:hypothetical protein